MQREGGVMEVPKGVKPGRIHQKRLQDRKHLEYVTQKGCCVPGCWIKPCQAHHLIGNYGSNGPVRGWGLRAGDDFTIGLCEPHHTTLHADGDEKRVLGGYGVDGLAEAAKNWKESHA